MGDPWKVEMVTITKRQYDQLIEDQKWLSCLEEAGVDNWSGIEIAIDLRDDREDYNE